MGTTDKTYKERLARRRARLKKLGFRRVEVLTHERTADKLARIAKWADTTRDSVVDYLINGESTVGELTRLMEADAKMPGHLTPIAQKALRQSIALVKEGLAFRLLDSAKSIYRG